MWSSDFEIDPCVDKTGVGKDIQDLERGTEQDVQCNASNDDVEWALLFVLISSSNGSSSESIILLEFWLGAH